MTVNSSSHRLQKPARLSYRGKQQCHKKYRILSRVLECPCSQRVKQRQGGQKEIRRALPNSWELPRALPSRRAVLVTLCAIHTYCRDPSTQGLEGGVETVVTGQRLGAVCQIAACDICIPRWSAWFMSQLFCFQSSFLLMHILGGSGNNLST